MDKYQETQLKLLAEIANQIANLTSEISKIKSAVRGIKDKDNPHKPHYID